MSTIAETKRLGNAAEFKFEDKKFSVLENIWRVVGDPLELWIANLEYRA